MGTVSIHKSRAIDTWLIASPLQIEKNSEMTATATIAANSSGSASHLTLCRARISRCVLWIMLPSATARTIVTNADR